ncbi:WASH complex subunit 2 [Drosophila pseudoobscura]|uniref:WASH complex subunit 2 n=1 Tax=Drosophila pseudoobscura pseudoobscura TaxID=46245 RepID=A0A6I8UUW6_DROPS|nr:WASH complex subunit 2 [Drosophila pseudoobscura]
MDIDSEIADITAQAPEWNFAGDCALLALMKRISQNLHERGERTTRNLREFETSVKEADIAMSNATNSLRSLQFGQQFVEYRVQEVDDDDFQMPAEKKKKPEPLPKSSEEMSKEFLENNLRMFRKNFEPVTIDVPDSDDDDAPVDSTTIFRAKNPYDAIPLPYIIGSREWQEHKYAGLYDSKENSDDEKSEEFSSSSSDERESVSSKTPTQGNKFVQPQLSDSSSLASATMGPVVVSPPKLQIPANAAPILAPADQPREAVANRTQPRPIISSQRNPHERDLFAALRQSPPSDDPPSTSSSPRSSPAIGHRNTAARLPIASEASLSSSNSSTVHHPPPGLFDEAVPPQIPKKTEANPSPIKRKPINLFNDDEFNSLMSEIVDKVQTKSGNNSTSAGTSHQRNKLPEVVQAIKQDTPKQINEIVLTQPRPKTVNLFDDSPPLSPIPTQTPLNDATNDLSRAIFNDGPSSLSATSIENPPKKSAKPLPKSLFDDDLEDDFLSSFSPKPKPPEQKLKSSLFDDDDLDIDDIFVKPSMQPNKLSERLVGKNSLFDDDDQYDVTDLFGSKKKPIEVQENKKEEDLLVEKKTETPMARKKDLFDDIQDEDLFGTPKSKNLFARGGEPSEAREAETKTEKLKEPVEIVQEKAQPAQEIEEKKQEVLSENGYIHQKPPASIEIIEEKSNPQQVSRVQVVACETADLFNEDFSDDDSFMSTAKPKSEDAAAGAMEISKEIEPQELDKEIKPLKLPETILPTPEPPNKTEDEIPNKDKVDVMADLFGSPKIGAPVSETPPPDDLDDDEDPIITMVADITNKTSKVSTTEPEADIDAAQQIMQNYTSLFSEEPPDDSEFFQTLGSSSLSSLSASKMFENEQDFFEPALPKIPVANKSSAATPGDHGAIGLFSDVPPDDDDDSAESQKHAAAHPIDVPSHTTRIHTIFYDDFSETARAGAVEKSNPTKPSIVEEEHQEEPSDEVDRSKVQEASNLSAPTSPVKKLKMPNININVQALLPGTGGGLPKFPKKQEPASPTQEAEVSTSGANPSSATSPRPNEDFTPSGGDNGLQHVNKTRARGPARRRPSTRQGRKENYAKSVLAEGQQPTAEVAPQSTATAPKKTPTLAKLVRSFLDSDDEDEDLFATAKTVPAAIQTVSSAESQVIPAAKTMGAPKAKVLTTRLPSEPPEDYIQPKAHTLAVRPAKLFDESDDDDDLFASAAASAPLPSVQAKVPSKPPAASLFSSDEDEDFKVPAKIAPKKKIVPAQSSKSNTLFSDDEDDDDLFGGAATSKQAKPQPLPHNASKPAPSRTRTATTIPASSGDNPLADLLGFK